MMEENKNSKIIKRKGKKIWSEAGQRERTFRPKIPLQLHYKAYKFITRYAMYV
jgi:hypothetical protein